MVAAVAGTAGDNSDRALARPPVGSTGIPSLALRNRVLLTAIAPQGTIIYSPPSTGGGTQLIEVSALDGHRRALPRAGDPAVRNVSPAWSEQARRLAFVRITGAKVELLIADAAGAIQRYIALPAGQRTFAKPPQWSPPQWSPDGRRIVLERVVPASVNGVIVPESPDSQIVLVDPQRGTARLIAHGSSPTFFGNSRVAFAHVRWRGEKGIQGGASHIYAEGAQLLTVPVAGGAARVLHSTDSDQRPFHSEPLYYTNVVGSPDGRHLALTVGDNQTALWDLLLVDRSGRPHWPSGGVSGPLLSAWSPDGRRLVVLESDHLLLSDERSQRELPTPKSFEYWQIGAVTWSPDSRFLAALSCQFETGRCELSRLRLGERRWRPLTGFHDENGPRSTLIWRR